MAARWEAAISRPHRAGLAAPRRGSARAGVAARRRLARPASAGSGADRAGSERGMIPVPTSGMVLAAGLGTRMRPISQTVPKPLIELGGQTLLDHAVDRLDLAGVEPAVVDVQYEG